MNTSKLRRLPLQNELHINNNTQYQYFLKKNFKYTNNLQMARSRNLLYSYNILARTDSKTACNIRNKFLKTAKRLKLINHLDLAKSSEVFELSEPKILQIIKKFRDLRSLSLYENHHSEANLRLITAWLKKAKHLISFKGNAPCQNGEILNQQMIQKSQMRFKNAINSKYLKKLELTINDGQIILPFSVFPRTLREIQVNLVQDYGRLKNKAILEECEEDDVLGQYENLEKLNFNIPMNALALSEMLDSIPNPSKITALGFCIALIPAHEYFDLAYSFRRFKNLRSLDLKFLKNSLSSDLLEVFEEFESLKYFKVSLLIKSEEELTTLGEALKGIERLQSLEIKIEGNISQSVPEVFGDFFDSIKELAELEILKINIDLYYKNNNKNTIVEGSLKTFSECLAELRRIKEVSFQHNHADWKGEFRFLAKVLKERCERLRVLEIKAPWSGFPKKGFGCKEKEMMTFLRAIENMGDLEKLVLKDFEMKEDVIVNKLFDAIKRLKKLRAVNLQLDLEVKSEMMEKVIRGVLKNGMIEDFVLTRMSITEVGYREILKVFDYKDFVVKKPKLKRIQCICLDLRNFEFN